MCWNLQVTSLLTMTVLESLLYLHLLKIKRVSVDVFPLIILRSSSKYDNTNKFIGPRLFQWSALSDLGPHLTASGVTESTFDGFPVKRETSVRKSQSLHWRKRVQIWCIN